MSKPGSKSGAKLLAGRQQQKRVPLPGTYSLYPRSPDERVTHDVLFGQAVGEKRPDLIVCVVDATNLRRQLRLVLAVRRLGRPWPLGGPEHDRLVRAKRGLHVDADALEQYES